MQFFHKNVRHIFCIDTYSQTANLHSDNENKQPRQTQHSLCAFLNRNSLYRSPRMGTLHVACQRTRMVQSVFHSHTDIFLFRPIAYVAGPRQKRHPIRIIGITLLFIFLIMSWWYYIFIGFLSTSLYNFYKKPARRLFSNQFAVSLTSFILTIVTCVATTFLLLYFIPGLQKY